MAILPALLTSGNSQVTAFTTNTSTVTFNTNNPVVLFAELFGNPAGGTGLTLTGGNVTWTQRGYRVHDPFGDGSVGFQRLYAFTGVVNSGSSAQVRLDSVGEFDSCSWFLVELPGANTTSPFVANTSANGSGTVATSTLGSFANSMHCALSFSIFYDTGETLTADGNYTELTRMDRAYFSTQMQVQYRADNTDLSPSLTKTGAAAYWNQLALEIAIASSGGGSPPGSYTTTRKIIFSTQ